MTQTNQNKDYSWQWLDEAFGKPHRKMIVDAAASLNTMKKTDLDYVLACIGVMEEEIKVAIQKQIDEHYIGKGELEREYVRGRIDEAKECEEAQRHNLKAQKLLTESEAEQRCIEARIAEVQHTINIVNSWPSSETGHFLLMHLEKRKAQLSTNNKYRQYYDTVEYGKLRRSRKE